jgi:hypothetical protein
MSRVSPIARGKVDELGFDALVPHVADGAVARGAVEIRPKRRRLLPGVPLFPEAKEEILNDFFRGVVRLNDAFDERAKAVVVRAIEVRERFLVASPYAYHQIAIARGRRACRVEIRTWSWSIGPRRCHEATFGREAPVSRFLSVFSYGSYAI